MTSWSRAERHVTAVCPSLLSSETGTLTISYLKFFLVLSLEFKFLTWPCEHTLWTWVNKLHLDTLRRALVIIGDHAHSCTTQDIRWPDENWIASDCAESARFLSLQLQKPSSIRWFQFSKQSWYHTLLPKLLPVLWGMNQILQQSLSKENTNKNQKSQFSS